MTAISPELRRLTRSLVRRPSRTVPAICGVGRVVPLRRRQQRRKATATGGSHALRLISDDYAGCQAAPARACRPPRRRCRPPSMRTISSTSPRRRGAARSPPRSRRRASFSTRKWVGGQRGDLRQVGDAEHLAAVAEGAQALADDAGDLAADAGVDLVEDQRLRLARRAEPRQRQHHPRELAAGGGIAERRRRHPRVRRDPQLDRLAAARRRSRRRAARGRPRASAPVHRQLRQLGGDLLAQRPGRLGRDFARASRRAARAAPRPRRARPRARRRALGAARGARSRPGSARRGRAPRRRCRRACACSRSSASSRSSTASSRSGIGLDPVEVAAQLRRQVGRARPRALRRALAERVERRVDARRRRAAAPRPRRARRRAAAVLLGRRRSPARRRAAASRSALGVAQAVALGGQLRVLGRVGRDLLDLGQLEAEQVEVALARALALAQLGQLALSRAHSRWAAR